jgi:hypothetical protein
MLFVSRQLYEVLRTMPRDENTSNTTELRYDMMDIMKAQQSVGARNGQEFQGQFLQAGTTRAMGMAANTTVPAAKLLWNVLTGQASSADFEDIGQALHEDPTVGGQYSVEVLKRLRLYLAKAHEDGRFQGNRGLLYWMSNTKVLYKLNATPTTGGYAVSPKHTIVLQYQRAQRGDGKAMTTIGLQYDICRDSLAYSIGNQVTTCEHLSSTGLNFGRDISRTRNQYGQYWNWGVSVQSHEARPGTRDSRDGRLRLTIPLP